MDAAAIIATTGVCLAGVVGLSYVVEALRRSPEAPEHLSWSEALPIEHVSVEGLRVRYIKTGMGPPLVLLHTLRTQLDIFQQLIPLLAAHFTVYALDFPGHGWSEIPRADYAPEEFYGWTAAFLEALDIQGATLAGVSIGGTIALVLAAREHRRVARVVAINPYDYPPQGGIRHSSPMARLILGPAGVPVLGATLMRLRTPFVSDRIMEGGVAHADALTSDLEEELYRVGARAGHYQGFLSLLAHEHLWSRAKAEYPRIRIPTLLIYGARDWAPERMREEDRKLIPGVVAMNLDGGHFLSLERPRELADVIVKSSKSIGFSTS
jgi:pimeloyl-ACP methyl ester carboxylesterase